MNYTQPAYQRYTKKPEPVNRYEVKHCQNMRCKHPYLYDNDNPCDHCSACTSADINN